MLIGSGLWKQYPTVEALRGGTLGVERGETIGLVGESGSGKSTLARIFSCLTSPDAGTVQLDGTVYNGAPPSRSKSRLKHFRKRVQMIFQDSRGSLDSRCSLYKTLAEPLDNYYHYSRKEKDKIIGALLEAVGLDFAMSGRFPHELSGGQRQRVVIARALALEPDYLICDEPLSGLDGGTQAQILDLLTALGRERGLGTLFITHDLTLATKVCTRLYIMFAGSLVEHIEMADVRNAAHPYTRSLFADIWEPSMHLRPAKSGADFGIAESGCKFRLQCPRRLPICHTESLVTNMDGSPCYGAPCYGAHWVLCHNPAAEKDA